MNRVFQNDSIKYISKTTEEFRNIQKIFSKKISEFFGVKVKNERPRTAPRMSATDNSL